VIPLPEKHCVGTLATRGRRKRARLAEALDRELYFRGLRKTRLAWEDGFGIRTMVASKGMVAVETPGSGIP